MNPGIFIGIGGSGVKSLAKLKAKIYNSYKDKEQFDKENSFIFIDTDLNDITKIQSDETLIRMLDGKKPIGMNEFIQIGRTVPANVRRRANSIKGPSSDHLKSWMIMEGEGKYTPIDRSLSDGAGAMRMDGRTSVFENVDTLIIPKIQTAITKMLKIDADNGGKIKGTNFNITSDDATKQAENANNAPNLWLISGSNGGTGSSMTLDILFILDRLYQNVFNAAPSLRLALLTPEPYNRLNPGLSQYPLNSYSFMWELNAFKTNSHKRALMSKLFVNEKFDNSQFSNQEPFNPYSYVLVFDTETKTGGSQIDPKDTFENVSKVLYLLCATGAGGVVNSNMINLLSDKTIPHSKPDAKGTLLEGTEWSKSLVATGGKSIEKPNEYLKSYVKTRFLYDIFSYGIIGAEFNDVYTDIEKTAFLKNFIKENIQVFLDDSMQVTDKSNLEKDIRADFDNIILGSAPEKRRFRGLEVGILSSYRDTYYSEIENKISYINSTFDKPGQILSKENFLLQIKTSLKATLNNAICEYGLLYAKGLVYLVDCELEGQILVELEKSFNDNFNFSIEQELKSNIDTIASDNEKYDDLVNACEKFKDFKLNKLVIEKKRELISALSKNGYLDDLMSANGNEKGLFSLISKFKNEETILEKSLLSLSTEFLNKNRENPFVTYLPPLEGMIGVANSSQGWKHGSEFEVLYSNIVALDAKEKNIKGAGLMGIPPNRNSKENSLKDHLKHILISMGDSNNQYFIDFAEQNDFDRNAKTLDVFKKAVEDYSNKLISENPQLNGWLENTDLGMIFNKFEASNKVVADNFKANFNNLPVFFPSTAIVSSGYYIYSFPEELKDLAKSLGYDENDKQKTWNPTYDNSKLEVVLLETGHSFDNYKYTRNYVNIYQETHKSILALDFGCHIHKGFVHLDLDKAIGLIDKDVKPKLVELAFYDAVLEKLLLDNPNLFNVLIYKKESPNIGETSVRARLAGADVKLPIVTVTNTPQISLIKVLEIEKNSNGKYELSRSGEDITIENVNSFSDFISKSKKENKNLESTINGINEAFRAQKTVIKGDVFDFIVKNNQLWTDTVLEKLKVEEKYNEYLDKDIISELEEQISSLINNNLFKG